MVCVHIDWVLDYQMPSKHIQKMRNTKHTLGGLFRGSFWGGASKITPCLKLVRIMLKTWNLARKYTRIWRSRKFAF